MHARLRWVMWLVVILILPTGCSEESDDSVTGSNPELVSDVVSVTGKVTRIADDIPVDGNAVIDLEVVGGKQEVLYLPSFFAHPPTPAQEDVYQVIKQLSEGNQVKAVGKRTRFGIELQSLTIL